MYMNIRNQSFMCFSGVSIVVLILMILGTGYEYYLSKHLTHKRNVIYDLEKHTNGKLDHLTNGNRKALHGNGINISILELLIFCANSFYPIVSCANRRYSIHALR